MKRIFIIHGWDGSPDEPMHRELKAGLEQLGYAVTVPEMPNPAEPEIEPWVAKITEVVGTPDTETHFIGHSIGCQAVLRYLETLSPNEKIGKVILIAPWMELDAQTITEEGEEVVAIAKPWMETPIDFEKVQSLILGVTAIFSDDDPYVPVAQEKIFQEKLGAKTFIQHEKGHFNDPEEIDEVVPEVLKIFS